MTTVGVIQSNYIPWKGYFDIIHDVDLFLFYDDVQYTKNDWRNRNKIKTHQGTCWLTVPIRAKFGQRIRDASIDNNRWASLHWKTLNQYYSRAPFFSLYREFFHWAYLEREWSTLSELNQYLIVKIARDFLGLRTEFRDSSVYGDAAANSSGRVERLLCLLRCAGATKYISGPAAQDYMEMEAFERTGIEISYKDYGGYPEYAQFFPPFDHNVSILDLLFHTGPDAAYYIWGWRDAALHQ